VTIKNMIVAAASTDNTIGQADRTIQRMVKWVAAAKEGMEDRRNHPNFLAGELRPELYQFE
jgi:hypothetical protein